MYKFRSHLCAGKDKRRTATTAKKYDKTFNCFALLLSINSPFCGERTERKNGKIGDGIAARIYVTTKGSNILKRTV